MLDLLLSDAEVCGLTKRARPKLQARVLREMGIPFQPHPTDPVLLVSREAARAWLTGEDSHDETVPTVNVSAIRRRGRHGAAQKAAG